MPDHSIALDVGRMSARYRPGAPIDKAKKNRHLNFMGVLENQCLVLNRSWQAVNVITVQAALSMMAADAATGMNFTEGNFVPVRWNDWLNLPVRAEDDCIGTPSRRVRAPLADKRINNIRGNRSLKEAGLTLKIQPKVPGAKPFHESLKSRLKFPEWEFFVKK
jgi:hypothetical protein